MVTPVKDDLSLPFLITGVAAGGATLSVVGVGVMLFTHRSFFSFLYLLCTGLNSLLSNTSTTGTHVAYRADYLGYPMS